MKILNQRDARWSSVEMGKSNVSLGKAGCLVTAISMLSSYFGEWISPDVLAKTQNFTKNGLLMWKGLNVPKMAFESRLYGRNDSEIGKSLKDANKAVILEVQGSHWVVCLGQDEKGRYRIADPFFGDKSTIARYKNQITGSAHFKRS